jgi:multidrug efflux pump subunit AcrA (membrane-fusion protein)
MKSASRLVRTLRTTLLALVLVAVGWFIAVEEFTRSDHGDSSTVAGTNSADPIAASAGRITIAPVTYRPVRRTIEAVGTLCGYEEVSICSTAEGRVVKIHHDVADHVRPGEKLLQIEPIDYQLSVRQAEKALLVELAKLGLQSPPTAAFQVTGIPMVVEARVKADNCHSHYERAKCLSVNKAVTEEELLDKQVEYRMAQAEYENQISLAKAELATIQMKQEALAIAEQRLADTVVKVPAPTQAVPDLGGAIYAVSQRSVSEGSYVHAGGEVYRLVIDNTLKLRVPVPDSQSGEVRSGQRVQVSVSGSAHPFAGAVTRINPTVNPATRTFEVEVQIPNSDGLLKVGGLATATIFTRLDHEAATVPPEAPLTADGVTKLLLSDGENVRSVAVTLGAKSSDWVEVVHPALPRGARVVANAQLAIMSIGVRH